MKGILVAIGKVVFSTKCLLASGLILVTATSTILAVDWIQRTETVKNEEKQDSINFQSEADMVTFSLEEDSETKEKDILEDIMEIGINESKRKEQETESEKENIFLMEVNNTKEKQTSEEKIFTEEKLVSETKKSTEEKLVSEAKKSTEEKLVSEVKKSTEEKLVSEAKKSTEEKKAGKENQASEGKKDSEEKKATEETVVVHSNLEVLDIPEVLSAGKMRSYGYDHSIFTEEEAYYLACLSYSYFEGYVAEEAFLNEMNYYVNLHGLSECCVAEDSDYVYHASEGKYYYASYGDGGPAYSSIDPAEYAAAVEIGFEGMKALGWDHDKPEGDAYCGNVVFEYSDIDILDLYNAEDEQLIHEKGMWIR